jgi:hypothetical protein
LHEYQIQVNCDEKKLVEFQTKKDGISDEKISAHGVYNEQCGNVVKTLTTEINTQ